MYYYVVLFVFSPSWMTCRKAQN